ncbi:LLM class F420-dependent oxidoreductase [Pseudonocardia abyssalis]|uniref:LLM class F420-dependent oxidoreductase n=1 Tax=Pseudonocardia abyssalis TaxID=2792008 RepID=A0ABS6V0Y3_9PSEU|nr:LLM class F420-dependent oxidoreductase [Pseudonocardia abyssalis]MBW0114501.1 LLM class F420-dependent oxidoreductase [Pseudonocardia abyssalis]MBW0138189.1 LLM class F420-dependent oxidoreductase [Pseudonocardia abyssalis]
MAELSVALGLWQDRPSIEAVETARAADGCGYARLWIGEMATYDAFALGAALPGRIPLVLGPFAVAVRTPVQIAIGAATVAELTGRTVEVAIGSSSPVVVGGWHGRPSPSPARALAETAQSLRTLLDGGRADVDGEAVRTRGYRLRAPAPGGPITVAAFGPAAVRAAARHADRMVLNLLTPTSAARLVDAMRAAVPPGRAVPRTAAWVTAAVDPDEAALAQLRRGVVGYLAAPGYGEVFAEAGFGDLVAYARTRPKPAALLAAVPDELVACVGAVGSAEQVRERIAEYGVDEVCLVPVSTDADPAGRATLEALAP